MDEFVRAARERPEPWDRLREQRVLEDTLRRLEDEGAKPGRTESGRSQRSPRRSRRGLLIAAAIGGLMLATGVLASMLLLRTPGSGGRKGGQSATPAVPVESSSVVRFADGSEAIVAPGGRVVVREQSPNRILLDQLAGTALFRVTRNPERRFEVSVEGLTIRVVGTRFRVILRPTKWVRVEVEHGLVEVEYEGQTVRLGVGDILQVSRDDRTRAAVGSHAGRVSGDRIPSAPRSSVTSPPTPRRHPTAPMTVKAKPAAAGASIPVKPAPAVPAVAKAKAKAKQVERDWIAAAMRKVDAARRAGRYAEAVKLIHGLIAKYPHNWRVSTAAFILARVEHARRHYGAAAKAYALYRRRSPSGPLAEDALAGEARARRAAGQRSFARKLARTYLKKYPQGTHAKAMRSVMR